MRDVMKKIIESVIDKYEDAEFSYISENEAEITCVPRFINDWEVNYFDDESQIYEAIEDLQEATDMIPTIHLNLNPAYDNDDVFRLLITW